MANPLLIRQPVFASQFTEVENIVFPETYRRFVDVLNFLNIDFWVLSAGCMTYVDFHIRFLTVIIGPIVAMLMLGGTYLYAVHRHDASDETLKIIQQKHMSVVLFLLFFVYTSASSVILPMFDCDALDDGNVYLRVDYTIQCDGLRHRVLTVFAGFMILVYPLGIPAFFAILLFKNRRVLLNESLRENSLNIMSFSDLWKPYRPSRFYYEVIECVRRLVLMTVGIAIGGDSAAQIAVAIMLAVSFTLISEGLAPYESQLDVWICRLGHAVVILSMYFALLLKVNISNDSQASQRVFEITLIVTNVLMVLTAIIEAILTGYSLNSRQVKYPWPRQNQNRLRRFRTVPRSMVRTLPMTHHSLGAIRSKNTPGA